MRRFLIFLLSLVTLPTVTLLTSIEAQAQTGAEAPGPSLALFNQPFYTCVRNFYVATTGNDSNDGSAGSPWRTMQKADTSSRTGGDCINVAPGLYPTSLTIQNGGSAPTSTGYVVYRCQVMDACHLQASGSIVINIKYNGNFVVIDGFE